MELQRTYLGGGRNHSHILPTLCIGNVTAGGAGKTPATLALAHMLTEHGHAPHIVSRGYGSDAATSPATRQVNPNHDTPAQVGDEPLMMAQHTPVWVGKNRAASIAAAKESGASIALMDDGLQNPTIAKTASLLVMDGGFGVGNGRIFPAGPLRESLSSALKKCGHCRHIRRAGDFLSPHWHCADRRQPRAPWRA